MFLKETAHVLLILGSHGFNSLGLTTVIKTDMCLGICLEAKLILSINVLFWILISLRKLITEINNQVANVGLH